ncbi:nucleotidyltransferase family protein [Xinfangfangia sp. CPCC 101601]|uniref:Nucleotidyltransferase family protein n=1 Tax=Pseudogemmobacter lacusdianii TaxID=3069608 RepID=A0ABU0VU67_9RHOB|nr:nucleotidyltransferase family protein [Xinfangfangia sp. CPCC 101601]MDQ2065198.1 nucleotidyltransferase family protein [Xinfangfangia sp. CPCC 101601]
MRNTLPLMIFAAGFGTRMRALTADRPKPLIPVLGRPLLDRALDLAEAAGCAPIVVNTHYLAPMIHAHLAGRNVQISDETGVILETGGGLKRALPQLPGGAVMTLNPDAVWRGPNPLQALRAAWDPAKMDALLLVQKAELVQGRGASADFTLDDSGRITRAAGRPGVVYLGAQVLKTAPVATWPQDVFSLNVIWNEMIAAGRAFALVWDGAWCDVGSPEGLAAAEAMLAE